MPLWSKRRLPVCCLPVRATADVFSCTPLTCQFLATKLEWVSLALNSSEARASAFPQEV